MTFTHLIVGLSAFSLIGMAAMVYPLRNSRKLSWIVLSALIITIGISYYNLGGWKLIQLDEQKRQQQRELSKLLTKVHGVSGIIQTFTERLQKNPNSPRGWFLLGRLYLSQNQPLKAKTAFAKAYQLAPHSLTIQLNYAVILWQLEGRFNKQIVDLLQSVLAKGPNQADALSLLAMQAFQTSQYQKAIDYWQRLLNLTNARSKEAELLEQAIIKAKTQLKNQNLPSGL